LSPQETDDVRNADISVITGFVSQQLAKPRSGLGHFAALRLEEEQFAFLKSRRSASPGQSIQRLSDDPRVAIAASSLAAKQSRIQTPSAKYFCVIQPCECDSGALSGELPFGQLVKPGGPPAMSSQDDGHKQNYRQWSPKTPN
jgi:hypothetical protein